MKITIKAEFNLEDPEVNEEEAMAMIETWLHESNLNDFIVEVSSD